MRYTGLYYDFIYTYYSSIVVGTIWGLRSKFSVHPQLACRRAGARSLMRARALELTYLGHRLHHLDRASATR